VGGFTFFYAPILLDMPYGIACVGVLGVCFLALGVTIFFLWKNTYEALVVFIDINFWATNNSLFMYRNYLRPYDGSSYVGDTSIFSGGVYER
jgi:hypothetical protein